MKARQKASRAAIELIKRFEGYRPTAARLASGRWTIGYGHTKTAREGAQVSEDDAEALLLYDLLEVQATINESVTEPINQNQFDALASFVFNVGGDNFRGSSVLARVNAGEMVQAASAIEAWRQADLDGERVVIDALIRRRAAEKLLFLTPLGGWAAAPTPVVRPEFDKAVEAAVPAAALELVAPLSGERAEAYRTPSNLPPAAAPIAEPPTPIERPVVPGWSGESQWTPAPSPAAPNLSQPSAALEDVRWPLDDGGRDIGPMPVMDTGFKAPEPAPAPQLANEPALVLGAGSAPPAAAAPFEDAPLEIPSHIASDSSRRINRREAPLETEDYEFLDTPMSIGGAPLLGLGAAGLAVFAGSVFWGVNAKGSGGLLDPMVIASVLGLVGIACVATAVYFLLVRLGGRSD